MIYFMFMVLPVNFALYPLNKIVFLTDCYCDSRWFPANNCPSQRTFFGTPGLEVVNFYDVITRLVKSPAQQLVVTPGLFVALRFIAAINKSNRRWFYEHVQCLLRHFGSHGRGFGPGFVLVNRISAKISACRFKLYFAHFICNRNFYCYDDIYVFYEICPHLGALLIGHSLFSTFPIVWLLVCP